MTDKEVAEKLCRSYHTVRTQKRSIFRKLRIGKDTELVIWVVCRELRLRDGLMRVKEQGITIIADAVHNQRDGSAEAGDDIPRHE
jgi:hypothetical protein